MSLLYSLMAAAISALIRAARVALLSAAGASAGAGGGGGGTSWAWSPEPERARIALNVSALIEVLTMIDSN